ncbi:ferritin family protein [Bradyrhizobium xenonodulans]|uniref:Ferritin family protein n=1 Tax=Bradyrhizobium xenonodulans TaxID=2736875 RepID=A0ABY7MWY2_9BRAD|nr:ferritin family protein [Bradyrhizobium xenonodulans]WBL82023.1 ferritin family protein [Bradyrhizobium xenonodulans]
MPLLRTSLLRAEPAGTLQSLDELFALANAMEQEAATKYAELAEEMQRQDRADLVGVFRELAAAEREHVDSVQRWSQSRRGKLPDPTLVRWEAPETFDSSATAEIKASKLMTPYRALAMAVRNEERAFAFWSYLAAFAADSEIKAAAEAMAAEELGHVATLRKARRRAYRQEPDAIRPGEAPAERIDAGVLERRLAGRLDQLEGAFDSVQASRIRELADEARSMSGQADGFGRFPASLEQRDAETIAEALTDAYLEGAETSDSPARLETLQALAGRSIARLAWLRSLSA